MKFCYLKVKNYFKVLVYIHQDRHIGCADFFRKILGAVVRRYKSNVIQYM